MTSMRCTLLPFARSFTHGILARDLLLAHLPSTDHRLPIIRKPPAGYVPGVGRGAAGFQTRSDVGPSMPAPDLPTDSLADKRGWEV